MAPSLNGKRYATELKDYSFRRRETTGPYADDLDIDALIVGAGFSGIFMLKTLRDQGFRVVVYEAGTSIGGTWHWNNYPGARTDSQVIEYEFSWPEVWKDWTWTTNYPDIGELRAYFDHVDKVVNVRKDCSFGTVVTGSEFDVEEGKWHVETADGRTAKCKYLVIAAGFDITTGGLTNMGIRSINGTALEDEWKKAANTYLGMTIHGYPNMFHIYGAHGPTSVANGPTAMEVQGRWIGACIRKIERDLDIKYINPTLGATRKWKAHINELSKERLFATTRSTYMGGSVPGKAFEQVNYVGGVPEYKKEIWAALDSWEGFELVGR